ncbi:MAG: hypothetical protein RLY16_660 [Bacteroidota bacterium]|jgi:hypothetical protein
MIEILALIFLCQKNAQLAARKGLKGSTWVIFTIVSWIFAEFTGLLIGLMLWGKDNLFAIMGFALFCAFGGYLLIRKILESKPDPFDDDINRIGSKDLQPPKL